MIVYCDANDCKWNEDGKCNRQDTQRCTSGRIGTDGNSVMTSRMKRRKTMTEYIRKQDAVDAFNRAVQDVGILDADDIKTVFGMLSPADAAPVRHGEWVDPYGNKVHLNEHGETCGTCFCNRCGEWLVASDEYAVKGYFCPNCGAKMDGGKNT